MIHIKELFRLQDIQHLRLIAGRDGLERTVTAAVLFEYDPSRVQLPDFYRGDLVVTTLAYARGDAQLVAHSLQALMNQGIAGLMVTAQGFGYAFPYSLLCIGMRANNPNMELNFAPFLLSTVIYTAVFTLLAVRYLRRHDAAAE